MWESDVDADPPYQLVECVTSGLNGLTLPAQRKIRIATSIKPGHCNKSQTYLKLTSKLMMLSVMVFYMLLLHNVPINRKSRYRVRIVFITEPTASVIQVHLRNDLYSLWWFNLPTATELSISQYIDFSNTHPQIHSSRTDFTAMWCSQKPARSCYAGLCERCVSLTTSHNLYTHRIVFLIQLFSVCVWWKVK